MKLVIEIRLEGELLGELDTRDKETARILNDLAERIRFDGFGNPLAYLGKWPLIIRDENGNTVGEARVISD